MVTENQVRERLRLVKYPGFSRDLISFGVVQSIEVNDKAVKLHFKVTTADPEIARQIEREAGEAIRSLESVESIEFKTEVVEAKAAAMQGAVPSPMPIEGIRHVIAVASGKGGVGKSTVSANLATALQKLGWKTGLCDCDLYGPSMALMFGVTDRPTSADEQSINPIDHHGLKMMSMGFLLTENSPAILRGPMVTRYTQQFLRNVVWGELDALVLDFPPGTGDIPLTILQTTQLAGAVVVTTPQEVALIDARKAVSMFQKLNVPIIGIVENMSYFQCPSDGMRYDIFGKGGGQAEADRLGVKLLGEVPLEMAAREAGDAGEPIVLRDAQSATAQEFIKIGKQIIDILDKKTFKKN
jgi:ATP-binding protein involved in chromosome partitioning